MRGSSDLETAWETRLAWKRDGQASTVTLNSEHREAETTEPINYRINWDHDSRTMRFTIDQAAADTSARDWILTYVSEHPEQPRGKVEDAFFNVHGKGSRALARRIIDRELTANSPQLAKVPGESPRGTYLKHASQLDSPLAGVLPGEYGETGSPGIAEGQLANSPPPFRGGRMANASVPPANTDDDIPF